MTEWQNDSVIVLQNYRVIELQHSRAVTGQSSFLPVCRTHKFWFHTQQNRAYEKHLFLFFNLWHGLHLPQHLHQSPWTLPSGFGFDNQCMLRKKLLAGMRTLLPLIIQQQPGIHKGNCRSNCTVRIVRNLLLSISILPILGRQRRGKKLTKKRFFVANRRDSNVFG